MPHVARNYSQYIVTVVGSTAIASMHLVQICSTVGHTSNWRRGDLVRGGRHLAACIIATFNDAGQYANATDGSSHAAILLGEEVNGLLVQEQYVGQPTHHRLISFRNGEGDACNDGASVLIRSSGRSHQGGHIMTHAVVVVGEMSSQRTVDRRRPDAGGQPGRPDQGLRVVVGANRVPDLP